MTTHTFEPHWPVQAVRGKDLYFYLEETESFVPDFQVQVVGHGAMLMFGSYSYLGLNGHPKINRGVRLLTSSLDLHEQPQIYCCRRFTVEP